MFQFDERVILAFCNDSLWHRQNYHGKCPGWGITNHATDKCHGFCCCLCHLVGENMVKPMGDFLWKLREATSKALDEGDSSDTVMAAFLMFSEFDHLLWSDPERRMIAAADQWDCGFDGEPF